MEKVNWKIWQNRILPKDDGGFYLVPIYRSSYYRGTNPQGSLLHENRFFVFDTVLIFSLLPLRNGRSLAHDGTFIATVLDAGPIAVP